MNLKLIAGLGGITLLALTPGASAFVDWVANAGTGTVGPNGSNSVLQWSGGGSDVGKFGSPVVHNDTFLFIANQNFSAFSVGDGSTGSPVTVSDTLRVHIHALNGNAFSDVLFISYGDYTLYGSGAQVNVDGGMSINGTYSDPLHASRDSDNAPFPHFGSGPGGVTDTWTGYSEIDLSATPLVDIDLVYTNNLWAITEPGSNATIATLPQTQGAFSLQLIPAPGSLLTALLGAGLLARRRRS